MAIYTWVLPRQTLQPISVRLFIAKTALLFAGNIAEVVAKE